MPALTPLLLVISITVVQFVAMSGAVGVSCPGQSAASLAKKLTEAGAGGDAELVATARALMELVDQAGARSGKYNVTIKDSKGIQIGDGNIQVSKF